MVNEVTDNHPEFLSTLPASRGEQRLALAAVVASVVIFLAVAPFAKTPLLQVPAFIPVYESALVINDLITTVLLFGQFRILHTRALLILACGYLFTASMTVMHALSFPGLFAATGLLGAGPQSTAWLYMFWHGAFPLFVIAYTLFREPPPSTRFSGARLSVLAIAATLALTTAFTLFATAGQNWLPAIMAGNRYTPAMIAVVSATWLLSLLALLALWHRRRPSVLDLWLMVVMCAWLFDIALAAMLNGGRYDLGFYAGRVYGLLASLFVLLVLLLENGVLYARLIFVNKRERAVLDNLFDCVVTIDARGIVRSANPAVERVLGYAAEELVGRNVAMLMPEPHLSRHDSYLHNYLSTGQARIIGIGREVEGRHRDGRLIPLELAISEFWVHGEQMFIGTLRDIRERRRFIEEVTRSRADAEQASRAKSAFLATMSHEIRTPMNGVIGMVEILANSRLSDYQNDLVKTIRESASTLLSLIDDILDFSKIEAGRLEIERAPLSVLDLVEGLCNSLASVAALRGVDLALFVAPEIPERVLSDDVRLRQVIYNLVGNAIKFSAGNPDRRGLVSIRVEVATASPLRLSFRIADNGIGMSPETLGQLFTPFTQAEVSTTRLFGGTGLGLAICRRLVDLMQGEINVTSSLGSGAVFTLSLPFDVPAEQPVRAMPSVAGVDCVVVSSPWLAVDDLRVYLEFAGVRVAVAADPAEAAAMAACLTTPVIIQGMACNDFSSESLHASFAAVPNARHLLVMRGQGRCAHVETADAVVVDGHALRRMALLRAVAVAVGRASPETFHAPAGQEILDAATAPSIAEARALGQLILVAEDDEINQKVILQQLALLGYTAEVAANGKEAWRLWQEGEYALLLTDLHMPELDGYALAEIIRREEERAGRPRMPILALTANALRGEASRAKAAGIDEYLTKPVQLRLLRTELEKWLPKPSSPPPAAAAEAVASGAPRPAVDIEVLRDLVGDNEAFVWEFLADYLDSLRVSTPELLAACAANDIRKIGFIAHRLKASSRSVGALALGDLCAELENASKAGDKDAIAQGAEQFAAVSATVDACIVALLAER